jgi:hypothetical protein
MELSVYEKVLKRFDGTLERLHPLLIAILEEVCDDVEKSNIEDDKVSVALLAFKTNIPLVKSIIDTGLQHANTVTLNYRDQTFSLTEKSQIYQQLKLMSEQLL